MDISQLTANATQSSRAGTSPSRSENSGSAESAPFATAMQRARGAEESATQTPNTVQAGDRSAQQAKTSADAAASVDDKSAASAQPAGSEAEALAKTPVLSSRDTAMNDARAGDSQRLQPDGVHVDGGAAATLAAWVASRESGLTPALETSPAPTADGGDLSTSVSAQNDALTDNAALAAMVAAFGGHLVPTNAPGQSGSPQQASLSGSARGNLAGASMSGQATTLDAGPRMQLASSHLAADDLAQTTDDALSRQSDTTLSRHDAAQLMAKLGSDASAAGSNAISASQKSVDGSFINALAQPLGRSGGDTAGADASTLAAATNGSVSSHLAPGSAPGMTATTATSTAPAGATLPVAVNSPQWPAALGQQVVQMHHRGDQQMELHLHPQSLGPLSVSLSVHDQQAQLQIASAHAPVRAAVEAALPQLREALAQNGIALGDTSVGDQSQFQQQQDPRGDTAGQSRVIATTSATGGLDIQTEPPLRPVAMGTSGNISLYA